MTTLSSKIFLFLNLVQIKRAFSLYVRDWPINWVPAEIGKNQPSKSMLTRQAGKGGCSRQNNRLIKHTIFTLGLKLENTVLYIVWSKIIGGSIANVAEMGITWLRVKSSTWPLRGKNYKKYFSQFSPRLYWVTPMALWSYLLWGNYPQIFLCPSLWWMVIN